MLNEIFNKAKVEDIILHSPRLYRPHSSDVCLGSGTTPMHPAHVVQIWQTVGGKLYHILIYTQEMKQRVYKKYFGENN